MSETVGDTGEVAWDDPWTIDAGRRYFAPRSGHQPAVLVDSVLEHGLRWETLSLDVRPGLTASATLVSTGNNRGPGVVLAHGGTDDGRRFFLDEAGELARRGARSSCRSRGFHSTPPSNGSPGRSATRC